MMKWNKKITIWSCIVLAVLVLLLGVYLYLLQAYRIESVYVEGNVHYTSDEIREMVMAGKYGDNSLFLSMKYKDKAIKDVPFIETLDITILDQHTVRIHVYEKSLAGYVEFLNQYFYFDKDGMVVESSKVKTAGIPQVSGLWFDYIVLHQYLPIEDREVFQRILKITQAMDKYSLVADKIVFDKSRNATVYFGEIRVKMGEDSQLDDQCSILQEILPNLDGKKGALHMDEGSSITFKSDAVEENISETPNVDETQQTSEDSLGD